MQTTRPETRSALLEGEERGKRRASSYSREHVVTRDFLQLLLYIWYQPTKVSMGFVLG